MSHTENQATHFHLIIVGDEILSGKRQDKHMARLIEILKARGMHLDWAQYIGDDPALKLLYLGTGNPGPDWNGDSRLGDNAGTSAVVALDKAGVVRGPGFGAVLLGVNVGLMGAILFVLDKGRLLSPAYSRLDRARVERLRDRSRGRSVLADKGA